MPDVPRIYRAMPQGPVTRADPPIAVMVTLQWVNLDPTDVLAAAVAWTRTAVEIEWEFQGRTRRDWVDAADVRRHGRPRAGDDPTRDPGTRPPRIDTRHRPHW